MTPRTVAVRAPAKVNLQLSVGTPGADGYHPLATVFQAVGLTDTVVARARDDGQITIGIELEHALPSPPEAVPLDASNLAARAARALAERYGVAAGADLVILKGIPVAGGMAGGSADAAAALVACAELWDTGATRAELDEIAASLGADVPFALHGRTAVGLGRGDVLSPAMTRGEFHWVLAVQSHGLSTAAVYAEFDRQIAAGEFLARDPSLDDDLMAALRVGDPAAVAGRLSNDLQTAAFALMPRLRGVVESALDAGALGAVVSGSGPTVAALARSRQHALAVAAAVRAAGVADAVLCADAPAGRAAVVADEG